MDIASLTSAVATVVLALLTAFYVRLTWKMLRQVEDARQPSVIVDLYMPDSEVLFEIGNVGERPALHVEVKLKDKTPWQEQFFKDLSLFKDGIAYLAPGRRLRYSGGFLDWKKLLDKGGSLEFLLSYQNEAGERFERRARFDMRNYQGVRFSSFGHPVDAVARELERMRMERSHKPFSAFSKPKRSPCPFCRESIIQTARKCHCCHEMLDEGWAGERPPGEKAEGVGVE
jgi:hypothetical protein